MAGTGIQGKTVAELNFELQQGGKFVLYQYCVSLVFVTLKRSSKIQLVRAGQSPVIKGLPYVLVSLFLGWWGIPWGPIYTIQSLWTNLRGGKDVTAQVIGALQPKVQKAAPAPAAEPVLR